jgi:surface antigen
MSCSRIKRPSAHAAWLLVLLLAFALGTPVAARAGSGPLLSDFAVSEASTAGVARVLVSWKSPAGALCGLHVRAGGDRAGFAARRVGPEDSIVWGFDPAPPRAQAPWAFKVTCSLGGYSEWFHSSIELGIPRLAGALDIASALSARSCDAQGLCFPASPFPVGQCTWYAAGRRPDLLSLVHGNAGTWLEDVAGRVPEGSVPVVGALAVWTPGYHGAGALTGHVAYVAAVSGTRILLDDSNWTPTPTSARLEVHEHWAPADSPSGYIYGGPAGGGPS